MSRQWKRAALLAFAAAAFTAGMFVAGAQEGLRPEDELVVIWRSGDADMFHTGVYLFTLNAKRFHWFDQVTLLLWGPSQKLLLADADVQRKVKEMQSAGVRVVADIDPSLDYDIESELRAVPIEVTIMGGQLVGVLKRGVRILSI
jgi:hypothetical protein